MSNLKTHALSEFRAAGYIDAEVEALREALKHPFMQWIRDQYDLTYKGEDSCVDQHFAGQFLDLIDAALAARPGEKQSKQMDALLNHCPDPECPVCAKIICPHESMWHFHHDGCPACAEHEAMEKK